MTDSISRTRPILVRPPSADFHQPTAFAYQCAYFTPLGDRFGGVAVINGSPEPDGAYRHFLLRVDPELRPILDDGSYGMPQQATARNAVASTFGMSGAKYAPEIET